MKNTATASSKKSASSPAKKSTAGKGSSASKSSGSQNGKSGGSKSASSKGASASGKSASKSASPAPGRSSQGSKGSQGGKAQNKSSQGGKSQGGGAELSSKLQKLFEDELKDIYWAETALTKALPKMAKKATSPELKEALTNHLEETNGQIERIQQIFELLGKKAQTKKCEAMAGLLKEGDEIMSDTDAGMMRDAGIISAGQKVEHYEIASYGTLRQFAQTLGLDEIAGLLQETLDEEKAADEKLTEVAESAVNIGAAEEGEDEEEDDAKPAGKGGQGGKGNQGGKGGAAAGAGEDEDEDEDEGEDEGDDSK